MSTAIVVGGGVSGLCASKILSCRHDNVILVERDQNVGGLLKSETNKLGHNFDQGTHFIIPTSIPKLNNILFEDLDYQDCFIFEDSLREGSFFNGSLSTNSGCIDTRKLLPEVHARGLLEILNSNPEDKTFRNLEDYLLSNYGPTFTHQVFEPVIGKLLGVPLVSLDPIALNSLLLKRLVVLDSFGARELKKSKVFDEKIAWTNFEDGCSDVVKLYPKKGGVGTWVRGLEKRVRERGVTIISKCSVSGVKLEKGKLRWVELDNGQSVDCAEAVWTIPPVQYLRTAGIPLTANVPSFANMVLLHFSIDSMVNTDLHWVCNYDPAYLSYRITLYPNITNTTRTPSPHHLTVEVIINHYQIDELQNTVFGELKSMGLIADSSKILHSYHTDIRPGWPIVTTEFIQNADSAMKLAKDSTSNVTFVGRGKGANAHFLHVVLEDLYSSLQ